MSSDGAERRIGVEDDGSERLFVTRHEGSFEVRDSRYECITVDDQDIDELIRALQEMR